jgi:F0F1-type ATP synthase assembly protein I
MKQDRRMWEQFGTYSSLAFLLPACVVVGYIVGYLLDKAFGTNFLYLVFLVIGVAGGFIELVRQLQRDIKKDE